MWKERSLFSRHNGDIVKTHSNDSSIHNAFRSFINRVIRWLIRLPFYPQLTQSTVCRSIRRRCSGASSQVLYDRKHVKAEMARSTAWQFYKVPIQHSRRATKSFESNSAFTWKTIPSFTYSNSETHTANLARRSYTQAVGVVQSFLQCRVAKVLKRSHTWLTQTWL